MAKAKAKTNDAAEAVETQETVNSNHYQEWEVKIVNGQYEKLKISRKCVKISDNEAETLNAGILTGGNTYAKMYFKPE